MPLPDRDDPMRAVVLGRNGLYFAAAYFAAFYLWFLGGAVIASAAPQSHPALIVYFAIGLLIPFGLPAAALATLGALVHHKNHVGAGCGAVLSVVLAIAVFAAAICFAYLGFLDWNRGANIVEVVVGVAVTLPLSVLLFAIFNVLGPAIKYLRSRERANLQRGFDVEQPLSVLAVDLPYREADHPTPQKI